MKKLELKVGELDYYIKFLSELKLIGYESRMRSRFLKLLNEKHTQFIEDRNELVEQYGLRKDGELVIETLENGTTRVQIENIEMFNKEFDEILNEDIYIKFDQENNKVLQSVIKSVLNFNQELSGQEADLYNNLCEKLEVLSDEN